MKKSFFSWTGNKSDQNGPGAKTAERARAALTQARASAADGDMKSAEKLYEESIVTYRSLGMKLEEAGANHAYGTALAADSSFSSARDYFTSAKDLYTKLAMKPQLAAVLRDFGAAEADYGDTKAAKNWLAQSRQIYDLLHDDQGIASVEYALGTGALQDEDMEAAEEHYRKSLTSYQTVGNNAMAAHCLVRLGSIAVDRLDYAEARARYLESIERYRGESTEESPLIDTLLELGKEAFVEGSIASAHDLLSAAGTMYSRAGDGAEGLQSRLQEVSACLVLAPVAYGQHRKQMAVDLANRAIEVASGLEDPVSGCSTLLQAARIAYRFLDLQVALDRYERLVELASSVDQATYRAAALFGSAQTRDRLQDAPKALEDCIECLEIYKDAKDIVGTARTLTLYGSLTSKSGDLETGLKLLNESLALCVRNDDKAGISTAQLAIGTAALVSDPEMARLCLTQCAESEDTDELTIAAALQELAELELTGGELPAAYELSLKSLNLRIDLHDLPGAAASLACCAHVSVIWGDIEAAVVQLSGADRVMSETDLPRPPALKQRMIEDIAELKKELSPEEFEKAWAEGQELELEEIAEEAEMLLDDLEEDVEEEPAEMELDEEGE